MRTKQKSPIEIQTRIRVGLGRRGYIAFTAKELRAIIVIICTLVSTGISYVVRCEVKFVRMQDQIDACQQKPKEVKAMSTPGIVPQSQNVVPLTNTQDSCLKNRLCYTAQLDFATAPSIILTIQNSAQPQVREFEAIRGLFIFLRARIDGGTGFKPWLKITVPITGQRWDIGAALNLSPWSSTVLQVPLFMPSTGEIHFDFIQGIPDACSVILTNFDVEPYTNISSTDNEVG